MAAILHGVLPEWNVSRWFNTPLPLTLAGLRGKVVVIEAFQMLCPGCVTGSLPQARRVAALFPKDVVQVVGLHTVFEHHEAMTPTSLEAFLYEYRINFPVGVDEAGPAGDPIPQTMRAYGMGGTPTLLLVDASGRLRSQVFGAHDDLVLGAEIATLIAEARSATDLQNSQESTKSETDTNDSKSCDAGACSVS